MLIRNAEVWRHGRADVRIAEGRIAALGRIAPHPGEQVIDARGGALLPGLHDHHIHLASLAVRAASVVCGPPEVTTPSELASRLAGAPGTGWIRGILYHESVSGLPDARELDELVADRPLRIQHRSGRLWLLNSRALADLLDRAAPPAGLERTQTHFTGRLFDEDAWLRAALGAGPPELGEISHALASYGVTGVTEISPANAAPEAAWIAAEMALGRLRQSCMLAGTLDLATVPPGPWQLGPAKIHLHEATLGDPAPWVAYTLAAHEQHRPVAIHCTTELELVYALAVLAEAGPRAGDRIEHAGVASDALVAEIAAMNLAVVSQPHFIAERGDQYWRDVDVADRNALYRLAAFARAGVVLAAGSDAPFGSADPWASIRAAVSRRTARGLVIGPKESLDAEAALALYLAEPANLGKERRIAPGEVADLCLLRLPWAQARDRLCSKDVRATVIGGDLVHEAPVERDTGRNSPA